MAFVQAAIICSYNLCALHIFRVRKSRILFEGMPSNSSYRGPCAEHKLYIAIVTGKWKIYIKLTATSAVSLHVKISQTVHPAPRDIISFSPTYPQIVHDSKHTFAFVQSLLQNTRKTHVQL